MHVPSATYRFQFNADFPFERAREAVPYLDELGITDVYSSPIYVARAGSGHGYDVTRHDAVNPELGGEEAFRSLTDDLRRRQMGLLLDIVPNHMCVAGDANPRWLDVLENGPSAASARFFDIDWRPPKPELAGRVLLPILPDQFGRILAAQEMQVVYSTNGFAVRYSGFELPLAPKSWARILNPAVALLRAAAHDLDADVLEVESIVRALERLPSRTETSPERVRERQHEVPTIKSRLMALHERSAPFRKAVDETLLQLAGEKGKLASFEALSQLLVDQAYRLSSWRVAAHEINYRRFFDVNDLAAIRVEDPVVFEAVHALPFRLAKEGRVTGLRIDHVDGLYDPLRYLTKLQHGWAASVGDDDTPQPVYVVVEKILGSGEHPPAEWPICGTTGYEFMNVVTGVLVDVRRVARLHTLAERFSGVERSFADIVYECKKLILETSLVSELAVLARRLDRISEQHTFTRDFTRVSLQDALGEVVACFPVYRTYVGSSQDVVGESDRSVIEKAIREARRRNPVTHATVFDFIRSVLLLEHPDGIDAVQKAERKDFVLRFQQLTGPVTAKGVEDTAFYRYFPLAALEEVGGDPQTMGASLSQFHRQMEERFDKSVHGLSATDTHDAKRSEDARARLCVLSELPEEWERAVDRWREENRGLKTELPDLLAPDDDDEYLFYQTVLGIWPLGTELPPADLANRISSYMLKAVHEAKRHSSWINPSPAYDGAIGRFVESALDPERSRTFLEDLGAFRRRIERPGLWNGLTQVLLKIAAPGVPDFYQGSESWTFNLVDPDNRRPIDFTDRKRVLDGLLAAFERDPAKLAKELLMSPDDGRIKLLLTAVSLRFRRANETLFRRGRYLRCEVEGRCAPQVIAFARATEEKAVIAVAGRFFTRLGQRAELPVGDCWRQTVLKVPQRAELGEFRDVLTSRVLSVSSDGTRLDLEQVFAVLPVALVEVRLTKT